MPVAAQIPPLASHPIVSAISRAQCQEAVDLLNAGVKANDPQAMLLGGRMLESGFCVNADPPAAARLYERALELGEINAAHDIATGIGLGQGARQDYEKAGIACRKAGADPQRAVTDYTLGYACTVRGLAAKLAREQLPRDAVPPGVGSAVSVLFRPASAKTTITAPTNPGRQRNDVRQKVEETWHLAVQRVPKADYTQLADEPLKFDLAFQFTNPAVESRHPAQDFVQSLQPRGEMKPGR
jgi:hypothetical protein